MRSEYRAGSRRTRSVLWGLFTLPLPASSSSDADVAHENGRRLVAASVSKSLRLLTRCLPRPKLASIKNQDVVDFIGAPEEILTPDPQIRSLGSTIEIIEVCYHKNRPPLATGAIP